MFVDNSGMESTTVLNKEVIEGYLHQLSAIHQGDTTELLKMAVRLPDALKSEKEAIGEDETKAVLSLFKATVEKVNQHRSKEGEALEKDFVHRLTQLTELLEEVKTLDPERKAKVNEKLNAALEQLEADIDRNRFEQELIYYLEKVRHYRRKSTLSQPHRLL